jgi:hypothetical protein
MAQSIADLNAITATTIASGDIMEIGDVSATESKKATMYVHEQRHLREQYMVNILHFGGVGDGVTDNYTAIMNAINSNDYQSRGEIRGPVIYFPYGTYYCSQTIDLKKITHFLGNGTGDEETPGPKIKFPADVTGIVVNANNTENGAIVTPGRSAGGSVFEGIWIQGEVGTDENAHGIRLKARAHIKNCYISDFTGNGVHIRADVYTDDIYEYTGNANLWRIEQTYISGCKNGLYTNGGDANVGICLAGNFVGNRLWGVWEESLLGNCYIGCHTSSNGDNATVGGGWNIVGTSITTPLIGCYTEQDQLINNIPTPNISIGGTMYNSTVESNLVYGDINSTIFKQAVQVKRIKLGYSEDNADQDKFMSMLGFNGEWSQDRVEGRIGYKFNNQYSPGFFVFFDNDARIANGYVRDFPATGAVGITDYYLGNFTIAGGGVLRTSGTVMPTSGSYMRGDYVENGQPSELGSGGSKYILMGWMRLTNTTGPGHTNHTLNTDWVECRALTGN